jgi:TRAP-type transport system periplasmic protein
MVRSSNGVGVRGVVLALVLAAATGCTASTDRAGGAKAVRPVVLRVLDTRGDQEVRPYVDRVQARSGHTLRLDVVAEFRKNSPTSEPAAVRAVQSGRTDIAIVPARAFHDIGVTSFDALIAPLTVDSMAMQQRVLASDLPARMLSGVSRLGLVGVGILPGPMRKPVGISRDLLGPETYDGARLAESPGAVGDRSLRALGAHPVPTPFEGADMAPFDGLEHHVYSIDGNGYDEAARSITTNVNLWPRPLVVVASPKALSRLSGQQRRVLRTSARAALAASVRAQLNEDTDSTANLCNRGQIEWRSATPAQLDALRARFAPVYTWLRRDPQTGYLLDAIAALRGSDGGPTPLPAELLACAGAPPRASGSVGVSPVDGAWALKLTLADLRAVGAPPDLQVLGNYGDFRLVFDRGRFAQTVHNGPTACNWAYGTFVVSGKQVELRFEDGGGRDPDNAFVRAGEVFDFQWSVYRGSMTWSAVPGAVSPVPAHAWRRISKDGSRTDLDPSCLPPQRALRR